MNTNTKRKRKLNNTIRTLVIISLLLFSTITVSGQDIDKTTCESKNSLKQWYAAIDSKIVTENVCTLNTTEKHITNNNRLCLV